MARKDETLPAHAGTATEGPGTLLGKRYADDTRAIELLCVKAGSGTLSVDGDVLNVRTAKPLPASD